MIDDHICDGDLILLERVAEVRDGESWWRSWPGHETTLKRLYREPGDMVRLAARQFRGRPILVPARDVRCRAGCWPCFESISENWAVEKRIQATPVAV